MQNIAHGAQPNNKQAKLGLCLQASIFSQRRRAQISAPERKIQIFQAQIFQAEFRIVTATPPNGLPVGLRDYSFQIAKSPV
jgi:hypothetical protein